MYGRYNAMAAMRVCQRAKNKRGTSVSNKSGVALEVLAWAQVRRLAASCWYLAEPALPNNALAGDGLQLYEGRLTVSANVADS